MDNSYLFDFIKENETKEEIGERIFDLIRSMTYQYKPAIPVKILDFGCGSGNVTRNALLSPIQGYYYETNVELYGIDKSTEIIESAMQTNKDKNITYVATNILEQDWNETGFHKIFSFNALHQIQDLEKLFKLFHEMLEPNGQIGLYFTPSSSIHQAIALTLDDAWTLKFQWTDKFQQLFNLNVDGQRCENPSEWIKEILNKTGFKVDGITEVKSTFTASSVEAIASGLISKENQLDKLQEQLKKVLIKYLTSTVEQIPIESGGGIRGDMTKLIIRASKI